MSVSSFLARGNNPIGTSFLMGNGLFSVIVLVNKPVIGQFMMSEDYNPTISFFWKGI